MHRGSARATAALTLGLLAAIAFLALTIGRCGLLEPSEGRYGSIAASMARSNDYLIPRLNGVEHFEKPPLATWAMALSLELFGESELALRLPAFVAALIGLFCAHRLGGAGDARRGRWAVLLALGSPLYVCLAGGVATDMYLAAASAGTLVLAMRALEAGDDRRARERSWTLAALVSALGFMVKGPVIWILTLLPVALELAWSRRAREIGRLLRPARLLAFAALALPWFVLIGIVEPDRLAWLVRERSVGAMVSSTGFHSEPFYHYVPIVLLGFLPSSAILLSLGRAGWRQLLEERSNRLLLLAIAVPFVFFSLSASKLWTYVLPLAVPAAALAARALAADLGRRGIRVATAALAVIALGLGLVALREGWLDDTPRATDAMVVAALSLLFLGSLAGFRASLRQADRRAAGLLASALFVATPLLIGAVGRAENDVPKLKSGRELAGAIRAADPGGATVVGYRTLVRSLPFYLGHDVPLVDWYGPDEDGPTAMDGDGLRALLAHARADSVVIFCRARERDELIERMGPLEELSRVGIWVLLRGPAGDARGSATPTTPTTSTTIGARES